MLGEALVWPVCTFSEVSAIAEAPVVILEPLRWLELVSSSWVPTALLPMVCGGAPAVVKAAV